MRVSLRIAFALIAISASLLIAISVAVWIYTSSISETLVSWDTPRSRTHAVTECQFSFASNLPPSASQIYIFYRNEGTQQNRVYIRFTASLADIEKYIYNESESYQLTFPNDKLIRSAISKASFSKLDLPFLWPKWWNPKDITKGNYMSFATSSGPQFWIDTNSNTLYYYDFS